MRAMISPSADDIVQWLLLAQCGLLAAFLWRRPALWPLAALLANLAMQMLADIGWNAGWWPFWDLRPFCAFLYGPLILALVRRLAWRDRQPIGWLHFLPAVLMLAGKHYWPPIESAMGVLVSLSLAVYLLLAFIELSRFHRVLRATRSTFEAQNLRWLGETLAGLSLIGLVDFSRVLIEPLWPALTPWLAALTFSAALAGVYYLTWRGLQQPAIFAGLSADDEQVIGDEPPGAAIAEPADLEERAKRLQAHMQDVRPFLDPELSVQTLAGQLGWPAKQLSALINGQFGCNFNDFINRARIDAACQLLQDPARQDDKLLAIQLDAGFASKSVFNAAFKRVTGLTPSAFRANIVRNRAE